MVSSLEFFENSSMQLYHRIFLGYFYGLLCGETSQNGEGNSGRAIYSAHGIAAYCLRIFAFDFAGTQKTDGNISW